MASAARVLNDRVDRRAADRVALDRPGVLRVGDQSVPVRIANLTREGCRIDAEVELSPGAEVVVGIAGVGPTPAQVMWRSDRGYGCAFERLLPPGAVTAAFSPSNVARFPAGQDAPTTRVEPAKLSPRARCAVFVGCIAGSWGLVALGVIGVLNSGAFGR